MLLEENNDYDGIKWKTRQDVLAVLNDMEQPFAYNKKWETAR